MQTLKEIREQLRYSMQDMADELQISKSVYQGYETGRRKTPPQTLESAHTALARVKEFDKRYKKGGEGHGHFKVYLAEVMWEYFKDFRQKREYFEAHQDEVREILQAGALKAKEAALPTIEKIRSVTGIKY